MRHHFHMASGISGIFQRASHSDPIGKIALKPLRKLGASELNLRKEIEFSPRCGVVTLKILSEYL